MCKLAPHKRREHKVRGHFRAGVWIPEHIRSASFVNSHCLLDDNE